MGIFKNLMRYTQTQREKCLFFKKYGMAVDFL